MMLPLYLQPWLCANLRAPFALHLTSISHTKQLLSRRLGMVATAIMLLQVVAAILLAAVLS